MNYKKTVQAINMNYLNKFSALTLTAAVLLCSSCAGKPEVTMSSAVSSSEASSVTTTEAPTSTPTPIPTPLPTPIPTPVPEYVDPIYDEEIWYDGFVDPRSVTAQIVSNPDDITVVVNKYYALPLDYVPSDLVDAPNSMNQQLRSEACDAWIAMNDACLEATGQGLFLVSGYRDANIQEYLFHRSANLRGTPFACQKNAWPGRSEHQLGLALDITPAGTTEILDSFGETTTGQWVNEHCFEYGFIRRYQLDYAYETGYGQEAWHYRYVGVELATYLYENDLSLEAYYGIEQKLPWDE